MQTAVSHQTQPMNAERFTAFRKLCACESICERASERAGRSDSDRALGAGPGLVITVRTSLLHQQAQLADNHTAHSPFIIISFSFLALKGLLLLEPLRWPVSVSSFPP